MMKLERILVPLDGSPLAEAALPEALDLARDAGSTLILLRAVEAHTIVGDPVDAQVQVVHEAERYLEDVAARLRGQGIGKVETSVWYGPAALSIVDAARLRRADLIAMFSHGRSGVGRLVLGSVAESVLRASTVPILLLRAPGAPLQTPVGTARPTKGKSAHV
jgi:nucleotide-binding universal stress UspA family protein